VVPAGTRLTTPEGKDFTFDDVRGKTVVIHFWSTTCPWEKVAEPKIMKLASDYKDKGVVTLAINANQGEIGARPAPEAFEKKDGQELPYAALRAKAEKVGMNHPVLLDHGGDVARLFAAKTTPHCFVLDGKGTLVYSGALDDDGKGQLGDEAKHYVRQAVDAVRAGKKVETSTTKPYG
jgi:thiol-disulfide isomerase/thioredoxin